MLLHGEEAFVTAVGKDIINDCLGAVETVWEKAVKQSLYKQQ